MYVYEYEHICVRFPNVLWSNKIVETGNYRTIIDRRAKDGWRYVGFLPAAQLGSGVLAEIDLIFEKER